MTRTMRLMGGMLWRWTNKTLMLSNLGIMNDAGNDFGFEGSPLFGAQYMMIRALYP